MTIFHEVQQASPEWFALKTGCLTASNFSKIITAKTMKPSTQADEYADRLICEMISGEFSQSFPPSYWMERGAAMEADAAAAYQFETGYDTKPGGFFQSDCGLYGASPDMRVFDGDKLIGGVEIKCPAPWTHVTNLMRKHIDPEYIQQVQGQIYVMGVDFIDWYSYHPEMPSKRIRTVRDDEFQEKFGAAIEAFRADVISKIEKLEGLGIEFKKKIGKLK